MFTASLNHQYLLHHQRNNKSQVLHFRSIRIFSIMAECAFCRVLLSLFHSKIVIRNCNNTPILLQIWKRVFLFFNFMAFGGHCISRLLNCSRWQTFWAQTACCMSDLKERLPSVHEPPRADPNKETGKRHSSAARVHSAHWCPSPPAHQIFTISQSGWPHVCYKYGLI